MSKQHEIAKMEKMGKHHDLLDEYRRTCYFSTGT